MSTQSCQIKLRLPDGSAAAHSFSDNDPFSRVEHFIQESLHEHQISGTYTPCSSYPKKEFTSDDSAKTLASLGLVPSVTLLLIKKTAGADYGLSANRWHDEYRRLREQERQEELEKQRQRRLTEMRDAKREVEEEKRRRLIVKEKIKDDRERLQRRRQLDEQNERALRHNNRTQTTSMKISHNRYNDRYNRYD